MLKHPIVVDGQVQVRGPQGSERTAIRDLEECHFVMDEHRISGLFQGFFNNKMTLLVFMIQSARFRSDSKLAQSACGFLSDVYRHMLEPNLQRKYHLVFLWLRKFIMKLPNVTNGQRNKALGFIQLLYDIFGIQLKSNIERGKS
ncbi:MAG TPA: hypothetical protein PLO78_10335 [Candidatus Omnitrophota bacterium]|nr:hypothetical protein [Candidatus Omnitrophota bacterium]